MKTISSTPVLCLLIKKSLLQHRLEQLRLAEERLFNFLTRLYRKTVLPIDDLLQHFPIDQLKEYGLVSTEELPLNLSKKQKIEINNHP